MGIFDFFLGGNNKSGLNESSSPAKNQILQTPDSFLDKFKSDEFKNLSIQERMDAYQNLENEMAAQQHRMPRQVVFDNEASLPYDSKGHMPDGCGYYTANDDKIHMNSYYLTDQCAQNGGQFDGMDTVIHEGRHAYHNDCINGYIDQPDERYVRNQDGIEKSYYSGVYNEANSSDNITGVSNYSNIASEQDTFSYAFDKMNSEQFSSVFAGDQNYANYINSQKAMLSQQQRNAYYNDATHNLIESNPEFKNAYENNLKSGMSPYAALNNAYDGDFQSDVNKEIDSLSTQYPPDVYSSRYMDELADKHGNIKPSESIAQSATQGHDIDTYKPEPENYSFVSEDNRNGYLVDADSVGNKEGSVSKQDDALENVNQKIIDQPNVAGTNNEIIQPNDHEKDAFLEGEIRDHDANEIVSDGNNYYDANEDIGYSPAKSYGNDTNNFPESVEEYNHDGFDGETNYSGYSSEENKDKFTPNYVDSEQENGAKPEEEQNLPNGQSDQSQGSSNPSYTNSQENGVKPEEEQSLPNEQPDRSQDRSNPSYANSRENGVKPEEEQSLPNSQTDHSQDSSNPSYANSQENGAKPEEDKGLSDDQNNNANTNDQSFADNASENASNAAENSADAGEMAEDASMGM
ncbi:MAG: hypothetical protein ACLUH5_05970 [Eubacterium sp.]